MFRTANEAEHRRILQTEKSLFTGRFFLFGMIVVFVIIPYVFLTAKQKASREIVVTPVIDTEDPAGFTMTEERVIVELYGDPETYADSKVWEKKSEFIDKERTSAEGKIVYDEDAMNRYRESMVEEFYNQIDHARVEKELEKRKEAYVAAEQANRVQAQNDRKNSPVHTELLVLVWVIMVVGIGGIVLAAVEYNAVRNRKYTITEGTISEKRANYRRDFFIQKTAFISYFGGTKKMQLSYEQAVRMGIGCPVYLVQLDGIKRYFISDVI